MQRVHDDWEAEAGGSGALAGCGAVLQPTSAALTQGNRWEVLQGQEQGQGEEQEQEQEAAQGLGQAGGSELDKGGAVEADWEGDWEGEKEGG